MIKILYKNSQIPQISYHHKKVQNLSLHIIINLNQLFRVEFVEIFIDTGALIVAKRKCSRVRVREIEFNIFYF